MALNKVIKVEIGEGENAKVYTLQYDRSTIEYLEKVLKFNILEYSNTFVFSNLALWEGGFQKHHKELSIDERDLLYMQYRDEGGDLDDVMAFLTKQVGAFMPTTQANTKKKKKAIIE